MALLPPLPNKALFTARQVAGAGEALPTLWRRGRGLDRKLSSLRAYTTSLPQPLTARRLTVACTVTASTLVVSCSRAQTSSLAAWLRI